MNERFGANGGPPDDEDVQALLQDAGKRPEMPGEDLKRVKAAARAAWRDSVRSRRWYAGRRIALAAAIVITVIGGTIWMNRTPMTIDAPATIARWEVVRGEATATSEEGQSSAVTVGNEIKAGDLVEIGDGLATIRIGEGVSLRLAAGTGVRLTSSESVGLERGMVYIDTGRGDGTLEVTTPYGTARDIGTRFQVRLDESAGAMSVSVREGEVVVSRGETQHSVRNGSKLVVLADGSVEKTPGKIWGEEWKWILDTSPAYEIEGRSLAEYLDWVSGETGLEVRLADPELESSVESTVLHGSTGELRADEAVLVVLMGAGLNGQIEEGVLVVRDGGS